MTALGASSKPAFRGPIPSPSSGLEMIQFPLSKILCHHKTIRMDMKSSETW